MSDRRKSRSGEPTSLVRVIGVAALLVLGLMAACKEATPDAQNQPPVVSPTATPSGGAPPLTVNFEGAATDPDGEIISYRWTFGDGGTSAEQSPTHVYESAGTFTAALTVMDDAHASASSQVMIVVGAAANVPPTASASATPTSGVAPLAVQFTGSGADTDGTIASYAWAFGDGGTSSAQSPSHTYTSTGNLTATLTVTDDDGATGSTIVNITVGTNQPPTASASANRTTGKAPLAVQFTGSGADPDGTIALYAWTFGDGGTSSQQSPSHTYASPGNYTATLTVTDNLGARASASVSIVASANVAPTASASATPTSGTAPLAVSFAGSGLDPDGTIVAYAWSFGDGGTSSQQNPSHTYVSAGNFTAVLTVTDDNGASGSSNVALSVAGVGNQPPSASAGATPTSGKVPLAIQFQGTGTDGDGTIVGYAWTFGDGGTSSQQNPSHTYTSPGNYSALLTVTDDGGATGSASVAITVLTNRAPTASPSATPTSGTAPLPVQFTGVGSDPDGTITSYSWSFGDGGTSSLQSPTHTYASPGAYSAVLTVTDDGGATGSASVLVNVTAPVNAAPVANAGPDRSFVDPGVVVTLDGRGSTDPDGTIASYQWVQTGGPAVTLSGANTATPSFTPQAAVTGAYTFTLTVTDNGTPPASGQDGVVINARVTYVNLVKSLIDSRGLQPSGVELGCTAAGCHVAGAQGPRLTTYTEVYNARAKTRAKIQVGQSMRKYLLPGEPEIITSWIDNGAPERN